MPNVPRPRRSALYMPGANTRAMRKARELPADVLIFDLEDAVAPAAKDTARDAVLAALAAGGHGRREVVVRANGLETPWGADDLAALAGADADCGADAVLLAKIERAEQIDEALNRLDVAGAPDGLAVWCMLETPRGVMNADAIAGASDRIACLVMGTSDLTSELGARHTAGREPLLAALGWCLLAARAHGKAILDGVHLDLADDRGFAAVCRQARDMGFDGKTLIHPRQIGPCNAAFAPDAESVGAARRLIAAFEAAEADGRGVAVLDGRLIENLHVAEARRLLALADALAEPVSPGT